MVVLKSIQKSYEWRGKVLPNYTREFNEEQLKEWQDKQDNRFSALGIAIKCVRACKAVNELPLIWKKAIEEGGKKASFPSTLPLLLMDEEEGGKG